MPDDRARYHFGVFEFDARTMELVRRGRAVRVRPQSLKLLALLLERADTVVPRTAIQEAVWGRDTFVDFEQGVNHCVKELRDALGDAADSPRFIQTLPRRGYRFIAPVDRVEGASADTTPDEAWGNPRPAAAPVGQRAPGAVSEGPSDTSPAPYAERRRARSVAVPALALAVVLAGLLMASHGSRPLAPARPISSLVVLPFDAPEGDRTLGAGLADAISWRLAGQHVLAIRSGKVDSRESGREQQGDPAETALREAPVALGGEIRTSGATLIRGSACLRASQARRCPLARELSACASTRQANVRTLRGLSWR